MRTVYGIMIFIMILSAAAVSAYAAEGEKLNVDITTYDGRKVMVKDGMVFYTPLPVTFAPAVPSGYCISLDDGETFSAYTDIADTVTLYPDDDTSPTGRWQLKFAAKTPDGGLLESDTYRVCFDTAAPEIEFEDPEAVGGWLTHDEKVHFTLSDENGLSRISAKCGDTVLYEMHRKDDEPAGQCSMELLLTDTGRPYNNVEMVCYDVAGNRSDASFEYRYDSSCPVIYVQGILSGDAYDRSAVLEAAASDRDSDVFISYTAERRIGDRLIKTVATTDGPQTRIDFTEDGKYFIRLWAEDSAGNCSPEITRSFSVDTTPPTVSIGGVTDSVDRRDPTEVTVDVGDNIYEGTMVNIKLTKTALLKNENIPIEGYELMADHDIRTVNINSDGDYLLEVSAADAAGNVTQELRRFRIDSTAPDILISGLDEGDITNALPTLRFSVGEMFYESTVMSSILEKKEAKGYVVAESKDRVMKAANDHMDIEVQKEGEYRLTCIAADRSGNTARSHINFKVDRTPPVISDLSDIDNKYFRSFSLPAALSSLVSDASGYTADAYIDDGKFGEKDVVINEGKYVLTIIAEDAASNLSEASASFIVDHTSPQVVLGGFDRNGNIKKGSQVTVSLAEPGDRLLTVKFNGRNVPVSSDNTASFTVDEYGSYTIAVMAEDAAANITDTEIHASCYMDAGPLGGYIRSEKTIEAAPDGPEKNNVDIAGLLIGLSTVLSGTFGLAFRTFLRH
ncbi:MAG: hypothetical protein K6G58_06520 [Lachnospiraceae bacterium]|nr:hypothetical protein [Lachnospiraceae bacterium]